MNIIIADDEYFSTSSSTTPNAQNSDSIIYTLNYTVGIYAQPYEMSALQNVSAGDTVILIDSITFDYLGYWYVLVDLSNNSYAYGFINKCFMDNPILYNTQTSSNATIISSNTNFKKFPSLYAPTVYTASTIGQSYEILDFADNYTDIYGKNWCRVAIDSEFEGYVLKSAVSIDGNVIVSSNENLPQTNATIVSINDEKYICTYIDESGKELLPTTIEIGASVRVVDGYNISKEYTQIQYAYYDTNSQLCVLTCYVATDNIYYEEVTIYQVIAFVVIVIVIILGALLIMIRMKKSSLIGNKNQKY